jgi:hypothetical protein
VHGAALLRHQGQAPVNQEQQERGLPHRQSQYPKKGKGTHSALTTRAGTRSVPHSHTTGDDYGQKANAALHQY